MAYTRRSVYHFADESATGIEKVPVGRVIIEDTGNNLYLKVNSTNLDPNTPATITTAISNGNLELVQGGSTITGPGDVPVDDTTLSTNLNGTYANLQEVLVAIDNLALTGSATAVAPALSGVSTGFEHHEVTITIDNYANDVVYDITPSGGSVSAINTGNGAFVWTLPDVTDGNADSASVSVTINQGGLLPSTTIHNFTVNVFVPTQPTIAFNPVVTEANSADALRVDIGNFGSFPSGTTFTITQSAGTINNSTIASGYFTWTLPSVDVDASHNVTVQAVYFTETSTVSTALAVNVLAAAETGSTTDDAIQTADFSTEELLNDGFTY